MMRNLNFADSASMMHAQLALNPDRPSVFVVTGPKGSGKTTFVKHCLQKLLGASAMPQPLDAPRSERRWDHVLFEAADCGWLWIDHFRGRLDSEVFARFVAADFWTGHRRRDRKLVRLRNAAVIFISGEVETHVMQRGLRVIELELWPSQKKGKA